jgi:chromosome segregation ATPase
MHLNRKVESLKTKLSQQYEAESKEVNNVRETMQLLEEDREKLLNTVEPLMKTNKDLQESLEGLANEIKQKNNEIKKLRASSVNVKREMEIETVAMETKVDDARKEFDAEMKEVRKQHKKEIIKVIAFYCSDEHFITKSEWGMIYTGLRDNI